MQAHAAEGATTADSASQTISLTVNPVAEAPVLAATDAVAASASVNEDGTVALTITPHFEDDADATNTITISGLGTATLDNTAHDVPAIVGGSVTLTRGSARRPHAARRR